MSEKITAYCLKTKKTEEMLEATVTMTSKGGYMIKGVTADGNKMCKMVSKTNAEKYINEGVATKGY